MGGTKKKTLASMEKTQNEEGETQADGSKKKPEKTKAAVGERRKVDVLMPKIGDQELMKALGSQKAITIYGAARSLNVSASVARTILGSLESKGMLMKIGGFSGHYVWAPSLTSRT